MPQMAPMPWVGLYVLVLMGLVSFISVLNFSGAGKSGSAFGLLYRASEGWAW